MTVLGRLQHEQCPPGTVKVTWDHGVSQNYRSHIVRHYLLWEVK